MVADGIIASNCRCSFTALDEEETDEEGGPDEEGPEVETPEGWGAAPSEEGNDWKPDPADYPDEISDALRDRLAED